MNERDAELIVLEGVDCCRYDDACRQCPYKQFGDECIDKLMEDAFTVLKRYIKKED